MTTIEKGNHKIMKALGYETALSSCGMCWNYPSSFPMIFKYPTPNFVGQHLDEGLPFRKCWNYLMEVVERLEELSGFALIIYPDYCYWNKDGDFPSDLGKFYSNTRIEFVWAACVEMSEKLISKRND